MSCLGVHFALSSDEVSALLATLTDDDRLAYVQEEIEEHYFKELSDYKAESDKAWDAMHRALADGLLSYDGGEYPLNHVVLGGQPLYEQDDYILSLKTPQQVKDVASVVASITQEQLRERYFKIDPDEYGLDLTDEDFLYTWEWFQGVRDLYQKAANEGRYILFTADQ